MWLCLTIHWVGRLEYIVSVVKVKMKTSASQGRNQCTVGSHWEWEHAFKAQVAQRLLTTRGERMREVQCLARHWSSMASGSTPRLTHISPALCCSGAWNTENGLCLRATDTCTHAEQRSIQWLWHRGRYSLSMRQAQHKLFISQEGKFQALGPFLCSWARVRRLVWLSLPADYN